MDKNEAIQVIRSNFPTGRNQLCEALETLIPELKKSDDEKIKNEIIDYLKGFIPHRNDDLVAKSKLWIAWLEKQGEKIDVIENFDTEFEKQVSHLIASTINKEYEYTSDFVKWTANTLLNYAKHELEKKDGSNYPYQPGWRKNYSGNKPKVKHSVLMLTTHGIAEGEWLGEEWCQYRWSCKVKDTEVLYWMHLSDLENLEKENEKQGEQKFVDKCKDCNNVKGCITCTDGDQYTHITEQKTTDKIKPKKKLKKIKQTYFQKQEWTGYDEKAYEIALLDIDKSPSITKNDSINWLKSLKERMKGE